MVRPFSVIRQRAIAVVLASATALSLLLASTVARADIDSDGDGVPDSVELATQRTIAATSLGDQFNFTSRLVNPPDEDEFGVEFNAGTFNVWYAQPGGPSSNYQIEVQNLVEWIDVDRNARIDPTEIRSSMALGTTAFSGVQVIHTTVPNADGGRIHFFSVRSVSGQLTLNLTVAQRFMRLGDRILTPMEVKMDITIDHTFNVSGANVGIEFRILTDGRIEFGNQSWDDLNGFAQSDATMNVSAGPPSRPSTTFFSWDRGARADGQPIPVSYLSRPNAPGEYALYLGYSVASPRAHERIIHDPTMGVESAAYRDILLRTPQLQGDVALYAGTLAAMAVLVAVTFVVGSRRRKKRED